MEREGRERETGRVEREGRERERERKVEGTMNKENHKSHVHYSCIQPHPPCLGKSPPPPTTCNNNRDVPKKVGVSMGVVSHMTITSTTTLTITNVGKTQL